MVTEALAYLGLCAVVICTPGPDTALTIRNSILGGRAAAYSRLPESPPVS